MPGHLAAPEKNKFGLVIPPTPEEVITEELTAAQKRRSFLDRHHIYFPRCAVKSAGSLAVEFRDHEFNQIYLPRFQHDDYHNRYHELLRRFPNYLIPDRDVMARFLEEARLLEDLDVCVKAVDMIDAALYEGDVKYTNRAIENRESKIQRIGEVVTRAEKFELVTPSITRKVVQNAAQLLVAA